MKTSTSILWLAALPLLLAAPRAHAQAKSASPPAAGAAPAAAAAPAGDAPAPAPDNAPKVEVQKGPGGRKTYVIKDAMRIEGKIQKPEAFFFYQKSSINYDWQELKQDFIPKILDSVSHAPF